MTAVAAMTEGPTRMAKTAVRAANPGALLGGVAGVIAAFVVERGRGSLQGGSSPEAEWDYELDALQSAAILEAAELVGLATEPPDRLHAIIFVLGNEQHVLVPSRRVSGRYLYLVLEKSAESLGLFLHRLADAGF